LRALVRRRRGLYAEWREGFVFHGCQFPVRGLCYCADRLPDNSTAKAKRHCCLPQGWTVDAGTFNVHPDTNQPAPSELGRTASTMLNLRARDQNSPEISISGDGRAMN